jgi:DNA-binding NarL/FixJ family response regulator
MDIRLRVGDGISAAREILSSARICVIFLSGNSDPMTVALAEELRPAGFIRKPYSSRLLPGLVREAYHKFRKSLPAQI